MDRPNFVFIITDQQRADYLGCYGHPQLQTPNIDAIAASGVRFDRFYVASPICMPNRSTIMTGRMPSLHGVRHNGINLSLKSNTFVDLLRATGYRTALIGKSHLQNFTDQEPFLSRPQTTTLRRAGDEFIEAMKPTVPGEPFDVERPYNWLRGPNFPLPQPYFGFEHVELCTRHGDRVGGHYYHWLKERHSNPVSLTGPKNALPHNVVCPQAWRTAVPEELYSTTFVAERTIDYLRANASALNNEPFFIQVSFPDPHHPFTPPGHYWDKYSPSDMNLPASFAAADPAKQPHVAWLQAELAAGKAQRESPAASAVTEREAREAMALTCGTISMIDDAVGRIAAELKALGMADNTVIVYTADHGDFLGDHQLIFKGPLHFQGLIRVPFIWSDPKNAMTGATQALSGSLDIARTILDRAGVEPYNGVQGRSLLANASNPDTVGATSILIEEDGQRTSYGFNQPVRCRTLLTDRWRFTIYQGAPWGELYDLVEDPNEVENLWFDSSRAEIKGDLALLLAHSEMASVDRSPRPTRQG